MQYLTLQDEQYMRRALDLAALGRFSTSPNPRVGCVLVQGMQIVGEGFHLRAGEPHAEVHALRQAGAWAKGATAYVTLEPCSHYGRTPPCAEGLIQAGVQRVVVAMRDPNPLVSGRGLAMLQAANIETVCGILEQEARVLNRGFLSRIERARPFVCLKTAMSLDGKTALADGRSQWITGSTAREDVQILRAQSCAVVTGIGTILADNPRLNVRAFATLRQPVRVVLDSRCRLPESAQVVQDGGATWLFTLSDDIARFAAYPNVRVFRQPENPTGRLDIGLVLTVLAQEGIGEVLLEAGANLNAAFLAGNWIDEMVVYQAPKLLGGTGAGAFGLPENAAALTDEPQWQVVESGLMGNDVKTVWRKRP